MTSQRFACLRSGLPELLILVTNCYFSAASLKFVTFVTTLPKVVTIFTSIGKYICFNGRVKRNILKYTEQQLYVKFNYGAMPINKESLGMVDRRSVFV